jgi:outer membrane protein OmpA-like peptidoglycan-associated protein
MANSVNKRLRELDKKPASARPPGLPPMPGQADDAGRPMDGVVFAMMSLTGLLALIILGVIFGTRSIERSLAETITQSLQAAGLTELEVEVEGRDVLVFGDVPQEENIGAVVSYVESLEGVISLETNMRVVVPREPSDVKIVSDPIIVTWDQTSASIVGTASNQDNVDAIVGSLESEFGSIDSTGLTVREGVASERDWLSSFLQLAARMHRLTPVGSVLANPDEGLFQVQAEFETRQERSAARQEVQDIVSATTFDLTSALTYEDAPPPPKEDVVAELQETINEVIGDDELIDGKIVEFETDSDVITPVGQAVLDEILEALRRFPEISIEIAGHTDDLGPDDYNLDLSRRRAEAVLEYVVANGESPDRFVVIGYGETRPLVENMSAENRARNRRIEFKALLEG